jgi:hypothetical protein
MLIDQANPEVVRAAVEQYAVLIYVEQTSGTRTNKTRNQLLQSLAPADLLAPKSNGTEGKRIGRSHPHIGRSCSQAMSRTTRKNFSHEKSPVNTQV